MLGFSITVEAGGEFVERSEKYAYPHIKGGKTLFSHHKLSMHTLTPVRNAATEILWADGYPHVFRMPAKNFPHTEFKISPLNVPPDELVWVTMWDLD